MTLMRNGLPRPPIGERTKSGIWFDDRRGGTHPSSLMTGAQARWVVRCHRNGVESGELAALLGVSTATIRAIVAGKRYAEETASERRAVRR